MGASICWAAYEADTQFTIFDLSALKKQCLISKSDSKQSETPIWPYLIMIFLLLLIADVAARKIFNLSSA
jgi:hypothetical protein